MQSRISGSGILEQNEFSRWLIPAIESDERRWDAAFARSQSGLESLADRALDALSQELNQASPTSPSRYAS